MGEMRRAAVDTIDLIFSDENPATKPEATEAKQWPS
jgi:hypothetical protein